MSLSGVASDFFKTAYKSVQSKISQLKAAFVQHNAEPEPCNWPQMAKLSIDDQPHSDCIRTIKSYDKAIFLFADMEKFSERSKRMNPQELTELLNAIYSRFMQIVNKYGHPYGIEVVKLAGDCIMLSACEAGAQYTLEAQANAMVNVGWHMMQFLTEFNLNRGNDPVRFRFGINVGPATKVQITIMGRANLPHTSTDWFGEGVNLSARMESSGLPMQIHLSENLHPLVAGNYACSPCEHVVESYGKPHTFFVAYPLKRKVKKESLNALLKRQSSEVLLARTVDLPIKVGTSTSSPTSAPILRRNPNF